MKRAWLVCAFAVLGAACRARPEQAPSPAPAAGPGPTPVPKPALGFLDGSEDGAPVDGGVVRRRLVGEPTTLNPVLQSSGPEAQVLQYVTRNLLDFDARLNLVPGLAEGYEISPDGRVYTVTLRSDAVWEDGRPVTSADAVFTFREIL